MHKYSSIIYNNFKYLNIFLLSFLFFVLLVTSATAEMISVKGDNINLRKGPGTNYSILWEYGNGYPLQILKKNGNWIKVKDFERDTGWIHKSLLNYSPHVIVKVNKNNNEKINIRKGPSTAQPIIGKAHYGVVFRTLNRRSGWINVKHDSGLQGWIKESLLWGY